MKNLIGGFAFSASSFLLAAPAHADDRMNASGTFTTAYGAQGIRFEACAPGQMPCPRGSTGIDIAAGGLPPRDRGVNITGADIANPVEPVATTQGYFTLSRNGDTVIARWNGNVTRRLEPDGTGGFLITGQWHFLNGTGRYQNISGSGAFQGRFLSRTEYAVEWRGCYTIGS